MEIDVKIVLVLVIKTYYRCNWSASRPCGKLEIGTGVTVITSDKPFSAAVDVRGGGPGTRETDMLSLENSIGRADAIVLSGICLWTDACAEIQDLLRQDQKGYKLGNAIIPLVPGAVIFDLNINEKPMLMK